MKRTCTAPNCDRPTFSRYWCRLHFTRWKVTGDPLKTKIRSEAMAHGAQRSTCSVEECTETVHSRGWCSLHYQRWKSAGDPLKTLKAGKDEGSKWRTLATGERVPYYVWLWVHHNGPIPRCACDNKEAFHVHHKDHDHSNDVIENLELLPEAEHHSHHLAQRNKENRKWDHCAVDGCTNIKGLAKVILDGVRNGYCPTHRFQIKRHGKITSVTPLNHSERVKAGWLNRAPEKRTWKGRRSSNNFEPAK